jgi:hypothetical protein
MNLCLPGLHPASAGGAQLVPFAWKAPSALQEQASYLYQFKLQTDPLNPPFSFKMISPTAGSRNAWNDTGLY